MANLSVYFIVPAPKGFSPGQRFRFEHYLEALNAFGIDYKLSSFYSAKGWARLYQSGLFLKKIAIVLRGWAVRVRDLFRLRNYSYVYIFREAAPIGPPFFEWVIAKILRKKIIYDFDDAIWIPVVSESNKLVMRLKWFSKVSKICKMSYTVTVGNSFLAQFANAYCTEVVVIPTVVDTETKFSQMQEHNSKPLSVGWTGTHSTLKYLDIVEPVIRKLQLDFDFTFIVIADRDPQLDLKKYKFIKWNAESEIQDLLNLQIGLMPLYDGNLEKGKCGFKAIQYMALGIPAVVSPVGVNKVIVEDAINGFVCATESEWEAKIKRLLIDSRLREIMGEAAKQKVKKFYSVKATSGLFLALFKNS